VIGEPFAFGAIQVIRMLLPTVLVTGAAGYAGTVATVIISVLE